MCFCSSTLYLKHCVCFFFTSSKMKLHSSMLSHRSSFREGGWKGAAFRDLDFPEALCQQHTQHEPRPRVQRTVWAVHLSHLALLGGLVFIPIARILPLYMRCLPHVGFVW